jgi:hypothetical protein
MKLSPALRKHFQALGKKGGKARAASLTPQARTEGAKRAAAGRWGIKGEIAAPDGANGSITKA